MKILYNKQTASEAKCYGIKLLMLSTHNKQYHAAIILIDLSPQLLNENIQAHMHELNSHNSV